MRLDTKCSKDEALRKIEEREAQAVNTVNNSANRCDPLKGPLIKVDHCDEYQFHKGLDINKFCDQSYGTRADGTYEGTRYRYFLDGHHRCCYDWGQ